MAQVWKIRLPDGRTLTPGDWTSAEPLWSTVEIGAGAFPVLTAFSYGQGGDVPGSVGPRESTLVDTNLEGEGSRLPENEELIVFNISVEVFRIGDTYASPDVDTVPSADAPDVDLLDMLRLQRDLLIVFRIAFVKEYTRSPLSYWPASTGVAAVYAGGLNAAGVSGFLSANNGSWDADEGRVLASPLYVQGGESMQVDVKSGPGQVEGLNVGTESRMRLRIFLDGYRRRPVA
jgi:hypothetical protein